MLMNFLATVVLFLFIGPFDYVSSREANTTDSLTLQVNSPQSVFVAVNNSLELNCTSSRHTHNLHQIQLLWKHNNTWRPNANYVVDNYTVQLKIPRTHYKDAGSYGCGVYNSSQFQKITSQNVTVVVGEKPDRPKEVNIKNVFGKPVQELTLWWAAKVNVTYELFVGRISTEVACTFNKTAISTQTLQGRNQRGFLSYHVKRDVLGQLFNWTELLNETSNCGFKLLGHGTRCDVFCAYVIARNAFGTTLGKKSHWNLRFEARCPSPTKLKVIFKGHSLIVSWQQSPLVWKSYSPYFYLAQNVTRVLTREMLPPLKLPLRHSVSYTIENPEPYAEYRFAVCCSISVSRLDVPGPAAYIEVTSKEKAPSAAPSCVVNRTLHGEALVLLKIPPKPTWNGIPRNLIIYYVNINEEQQRAVNISRDELHEDRPVEVWLRDLDPRKDYSMTVTMCTGGGCGENASQCSINEATEDSIINASNKTPPSHTGMELKWTVISVGLSVGISLVFIAALSIKRQRSRREKKLPLEKLLSNLSENNFHQYENVADDRPSLCQDSSNYDVIPTTPLLKDVDCSVGNCHVSKL